MTLCNISGSGKDCFGKRNIRFKDVLLGKCGGCDSFEECFDLYCKRKNRNQDPEPILL